MRSETQAARGHSGGGGRRTNDSVVGAFGDVDSVARDRHRPCRRSHDSLRAISGARRNRNGADHNLYAASRKRGRAGSELAYEAVAGRPSSGLARGGIWSTYRRGALGGHSNARSDGGSRWVRATNPDRGASRFRPNDSRGCYSSSGTRFARARCVQVGRVEGRSARSSAGSVKRGKR